jgi:hypothetical protein
MSKKVTAEELIELSKAHELYYNSKLEIASVTIAEEKLKTRRQMALSNFSEHEHEVQELMDKVKEKYGEGKVNLTTGQLS